MDTLEAWKREIGWSHQARSSHSSSNGRILHMSRFHVTVFHMKNFPLLFGVMKSPIEPDGFLESSKYFEAMFIGLDRVSVNMLYSQKVNKSSRLFSSRCFEFAIYKITPECHTQMCGCSKHAVTVATTVAWVSATAPGGGTRSVPAGSDRDRTTCPIWTIKRKQPHLSGFETLVFMHCTLFQPPLSLTGKINI